MLTRENYLVLAKYNSVAHGVCDMLNTCIKVAWRMYTKCKVSDPTLELLFQKLWGCRTRNLNF